jgi:hypothetical protein
MIETSTQTYRYNVPSENYKNLMAFLEERAECVFPDYNFDNAEKSGKQTTCTSVYYLFEQTLRLDYHYAPQKNKGDLNIEGWGRNSKKVATGLIKLAGINFT